MHFFGLITKNKIDNIIFFGLPHGPWSIALWGLAKSLDINVMYTSGVDISTDLTTIETYLTVKRKYTKYLDILGRSVNDEDKEVIKSILKNKIKKFTQDYEDRKMNVHKNIHKLYLKRVASLIFKKPLSIILVRVRFEYK